MEIRIRRFNESDVDYLAEILKLNGQYEYPAIEGPEAMRRVANCDAAVFLVTEVGEQPCGFIKAVYDGSRALIHLLSVHPGHQRRGVGSALVDAVCAELFRRGVPTVSATVSEQSVGFWEKKGFRRTPAFVVLKEDLKETATDFGQQILEDMRMRDHQHNKGESEPIFDFDAVFDPDNYLYFYEERISEERTALEVDFLVEQLELSSPMRILDLACGHGRHANRLAQLGHPVVGVDANVRFLEIARADASQRGVNVKYVQCDMRDISYQSEFDRVLLLFTSFGYFSDADNLRVLKNVAAALKPQGLLCLDTHNRDVFLKNLRPYIVMEKEGDLMIDRIFFDAEIGRLRNDRIYLRNGKRTDAPFSVRLYNFTEIRDLLETARLKISDVCGSWDARPFTSDSRAMIILARKGG